MSDEMMKWWMTEAMPASAGKFGLKVARENVTNFRKLFQSNPYPYLEYWNRIWGSPFTEEELIKMIRGE